MTGVGQAPVLSTVEAVVRGVVVVVVPVRIVEVMVVVVTVVRVVVLAWQRVSVHAALGFVIGVECIPEGCWLGTEDSCSQPGHLL